MNKILNLKKESPIYGHEHREIVIPLTDEQKKEIKILLKELLRYCSEKRVKYVIDARIMALYSYVRDWGFFMGHTKMRESTVRYYEYFTYGTQTDDEHVTNILRKVEKIMTPDKYRQFFKELNQRINKHYE